MPASTTRPTSTPIDVNPRAPDAETWGMSRWSFGPGHRVAVTILMAALAAGAATSAVLGHLVATPVFVVLALFMWRMGGRNYVELRTDELFVRNPVHDWSIPLPSIVSVTPGPLGLSVERTDGSTLLAWAVQKPRTAIARQQRSVADDAADAITARLAA